MRFTLLLLTASLAACGGGGEKQTVGPVKPVVVSAPELPANTIKSGDIELRACPKYAGAICRLKYKGKELVDNYDFGRQFQSAVNYLTENGPEAYNPTEAGNARDTDKTTSELLSIDVKDNTIYTSAQMAYWLEPNQCSGISCAVNDTELSHTYMTKEVSIGYNGFDNVVHFKLQFDLESAPHDDVLIGEDVQFQVISTHTPASWDKFYLMQDGIRDLAVNDEKNHHYFYPIISASRDGSEAIAIVKIRQQGYHLSIYSVKHAKSASSSLQGESGVTALFDVYKTKYVPGSTHYFETLVVFGTLEEVKKTVEALM